MMVRQGDVLLVRVSRMPRAGRKRVAPTGRGIVLAEGEVTGHAHVLPAETVKMWSVGDQRYITVARTSVLTHEEHAPVTVSGGSYQVLIQREYHPKEIRQVAD